MNFVVHFPLLQPIISLSYLLEIQAIDDKILENKTNYKKFESAETYMDQSNRKVCRKTALGCSRTNTRLKKLRIALVSEHLDTRMYEAFLESGPQASLQIMVVMSQGFSGYMHLASILTSLGSLTSYASDIFWEYPTKVSLETSIDIGWNKTDFIFSELRSTRNVFNMAPYSCSHFDGCYRSWESILPFSNICNVQSICLVTSWFVFLNHICQCTMD